MINIILDTNILHQIGHKWSKMDVIHKLIEANEIKLYVPELVSREYITKKKDNIAQCFSKTRKELDSIVRHAEEHPDTIAKIKSVLDTISSYEPPIVSTVESEHKKWLDKYKIISIPFRNENITKVMDDYFSGEGAYKQLKSRDDIPDSMIGFSIIDTLEHIGEAVVIVKDGSFKKYLSSIPNILTYDSLDELIQRDDISNTLRELTKRQYNLDVIHTDAFTELFTRILETSEFDHNYYAYLSDDAVVNIEILDVPSYGHSVEFSTPADINHLIIEDVYESESDNYICDISFETTGGLNFVTDYASYMDLSRMRNRDVDVSSMSGDGLCDCHEQYNIMFKGTLTIDASVFHESKILIEETELKPNMRIEIEIAELLSRG
ncbi:TPA: PIN domain-containing protein [Serratia marcescens]|uniref:PIN domain-containing protein n=1 Tax=Serratia marcescens TaxID=615 RepID=UPI003879F425|nr:hypothetical protein SMEM02_13640 [Serratia marcescens]